jgi:polyhydroxyalkanoate synthase
VVYEIERVRLLHYKPQGPIRYKTPLIFVYALVNRPYILDLKKGKSVVEHFVKAGFDTYLIDWGVPTHADRHKTLDDYINGYMMDILEFVQERNDVDQVSLMGYCMGGTMAAMFTALHQKIVKNLALMATGIDFDNKDSLINVWADPKYFDVDKFVDVMGNCPAEMLQGSFLMLKPISNLIEKPISLFEKIDDEKFVDDYFHMEQWINDNIPVPGEAYREFTKFLYQQNLLARGQMPVGRHMVNLSSITCPVLNLMASKDDLVPAAQSQPFTDLVGSKDKKTIIFPAGHIGLAVGSKAQKELWPQVCEWLGEHSDPARKGDGKSKA